MTATPTNHLLEIKEIGQSIWMDNLTRDLIESGELKQMIESRGLRGITSNPAIFEKAIAGNVIYDADIEAGIRAGKSVMEIYESLVFEDIRNACDIFAPVYAESKGLTVTSVSKCHRRTPTTQKARLAKPCAITKPSAKKT